MQATVESNQVTLKTKIVPEKHGIVKTMLNGIAVFHLIFYFIWLKYYEISNLKQPTKKGE